jgi:hypothetical protein
MLLFDRNGERVFGMVLLVYMEKGT